ncbi:TetR/AcrR family transcriptional regulator [Streptococcus merionis]|uniref:Transcriptional regulator, TetR family n=1 Tax=Streptococcus merionis TaxID=400065 RepID=A0A239SPR3_9STRE|nr:TetR/AcrR family transcriptional regulator [Streptococcus merionis]SNU86633.1 Transcriptional regulator, TetR family [Streptococcus merionis]
MASSDNINYKFLRAFSELLKTKNFEQIKVNELAKKAQLSRRAFYNHYNSKEDFLRESILIILDDITKILNSDLLYEQAILEKMLHYMYANREIIKSFVHFFPNINIIIKDYIKDMIIHSEIPNLEKQLETAYQVPYKFALDIYVFTIESIILNWIDNDFHEKPEEIAKYITIVVRI